MSRERDLERLYAALRRLEKGVGGKRLLRDCTGRQAWPERGIYLFFEPTEYRLGRDELRVVRVGTHAVRSGSHSTLWGRLRSHKGTGDGLGNHRGSIFRLHVGAALANRDPALRVPTWGVGGSADRTVRAAEQPLERAVSEYLGGLSLLWLSVLDEPGPDSDRAFLEQNLIGLLCGKSGPLDPPSDTWLGLNSPRDEIRRSGLWNLDYLGYDYSPDLLEVLNEYVALTTGKRLPFRHSIAPAGWRT